MNIIVDAIYEAGVLKPLTPLVDLPDRAKVRLTIEPETANGGNQSMRFPAELLTRIDQRRALIFHRVGELSDSSDLINEGRDQELE